MQLWPEPRSSEGGFRQVDYRSLKNLYVRLTRWLVLLLGGVLLGGGLVLHAQVAVMQHMRDEVENTFILWRGIGKLTFMFQDEFTQASLALHDFPPGFLAEADRAAWVLVVIGALVALLSNLVPVQHGQGHGKKRRQKT